MYDDDDCGWLAGYNDDRMDWRFAVVECGDFLLIILNVKIVNFFQFFYYPSGFTVICC